MKSGANWIDFEFLAEWFDCEGHATKGENGKKQELLDGLVVGELCSFEL